jgi:hypothetical protein
MTEAALDGLDANGKVDASRHSMFAWDKFCTRSKTALLILIAAPTTEKKSSPF